MSTSSFEAGVLPRRAVADGQYLNPTDPAILGITDFTREYPVTVDADRHIDEALDDMVRVGVRALLVTREIRILGLITSYDIQGERPIQFLQSSNYAHHRDVRVADIMTPWESLSALSWDIVQSMQASELLGLVEDAGLTHVLVVEGGARTSACVIRALVSRARLQRQLSGMRRAG